MKKYLRLKDNAILTEQQVRFEFPNTTFPLDLPKLDGYVNVDTIQIPSSAWVLEKTDTELLHEHSCFETEKVFCAIGRYIVAFEHMCSSMHMAITFILHSQGLKNQQMAHIICADQTAAPLLSLLQSMAGQIQTGPASVEILNMLFKRIKDAIETRNKIIHSQWFVGADALEELAVASGHKLSRRKTGSTVKPFKYTASDFDEAGCKVRELESLILKLIAVFGSGKNVSDVLEIKDGEICVLDR